jgi:hypothetical protein
MFSGIILLTITILIHLPGLPVIREVAPAIPEVLVAPAIQEAAGPHQEASKDV